MSLLSRIDHHTNLFLRMSEARNADVADALMHGRIDPQTLRSSVFRCMQCDETGKCEQWLDEDGEGPTPEPLGCRNRSLLERLGR